MTQPTYSFVIPHYNIPELLERCINSIPERDDIQIIVVDDGSGLKPAVTRSDVELILLPEHTNAGNARNVGVSKAKGKWVLFPDADDFYNPGFLDEIDKYIDTDNQIVFFSVNSVYSDTLKPAFRCVPIEKSIEGSLNGDKKELDHLLFKRGNVNNLMILRSFIEQYDIRFESAVINNDVLFHMNSCYHVKRYAILDKKLYCLTKRIGSLQCSKNTLEKHYAHLGNLVKRYKCLAYIGLPLRRPIWWNLLYGYDNSLHRKNRFQRHVNRSIYLIKSLIVLTTGWKRLYDTRMFYVEEIKRSTAYAQQHCNE